MLSNEVTEPKANLPPGLFPPTTVRPKSSDGYKVKAALSRSRSKKKLPKSAPLTNSQSKRYCEII